MRRREFLRGAAGAAALASCQTSGREARRAPNVIYVFSDEHRWQSMSFTEMPELHTPAMARMAAEGAHFSQCVSNYPVCSPYRASLLTGRWPYQHGVIDNSIPLDSRLPTLGTIFRDAGYATGYIGKWHLGGVRAEPFGFEHSLIWTGDNTHWDEAEYHPREGEAVRPKGYNGTLMTDQALAFVEANRDRPFLLMLSLNPPHSDFLDAPEGKKSLYPEGSLRRRPNTPAAAGDSTGKGGSWGRYSWPYYQGYHAHISAIDEELGRILDTVERLGLGADTMVVYSSDHGTMMGSQGLGGKRQPYEESVRVPFLVRWPGRIAAGTAVDALLGTVDMLPTLCGLAGVAHGACAGQDFSAWLRGGRGPEPEAQLLMHIAKEGASGGVNHPAPLFRGVRTKRHTYAVQPERDWVLFDNVADPYQLRNLIGEARERETVERLRRMLRELLARAEDPFVIPA